MDILTHLLELRGRLLAVMAAFACVFVVFFHFSSQLFALVVSPLLAALPSGEGLIAISISSTVLTPVRMAVNLSMLCITPFALWQLWRFIAPALYCQERNKLRAALCLSLILFGLGVLFCFYLVLPFLFSLFAKALPQGVRMMPDMANALDFITYMLLLFGLCFQVPLICLVLVRLGWVEPASLKLVRPYVIVGAFVLGMLLTPPDVFSQVMLAVPLCLLYELGILLAMRK